MRRRCSCRNRKSRWSARIWPLSSRTPRSRRASTRRARSDALQLMTVHSAKGLEFQAVFVTGLEEGLFPHEQSRNEDDGPGGGTAPDVRGDHARAFAPVPVVRADRMLHGQTRYNVASRFLDEIPAAW